MTAAGKFELVMILFEDGVIDSETAKELLEYDVADGNWNDVAQQVANQKKEANENKSKDEKCTCPTYKLTQQGCPKLRGEKECAT